MFYIDFFSKSGEWIGGQWIPFPIIEDMPVTGGTDNVWVLVFTLIADMGKSAIFKGTLDECNQLKAHLQSVVETNPTGVVHIRDAVMQVFPPTQEKEEEPISEV